MGECIIELDNRVLNENPNGTIIKKPFNYIPDNTRKKIYGIETEFGTIALKRKRLDDFQINGGRIYIDLRHIEYCTPETRNPIEAIVYDKAGEKLCEPFAEKLFKNNEDFIGNTYGTHENYYAKVLHDELISILPFFVTRQIYAGSGSISAGKMKISQRSPYFNLVDGDENCRNKAIIDKKFKYLYEDDSEFNRIHITLGDANMCEIANFLKIGTTSLVLDLLEDKKHPIIEYEPKFAIEDLHQINNQLKEWKIFGANNNTFALDIQKIYLEHASKNYENRDETTNIILDAWEKTIKILEKNPSDAFGSIDWVTKFEIIRQYMSKKKIKSLLNEKVKQIDLIYHDVNKENSIFYRLQNSNKIDRLVTNEMIKKAEFKAPKDTRAYIRSKMIGGFINRNEKLTLRYWENAFSSKLCECGEHHKNEQEKFALSDPFNSYAHLEKRIKKYDIEQKKKITADTENMDLKKFKLFLAKSFPFLCYVDLNQNDFENFEIEEIKKSKQTILDIFENLNIKFHQKGQYYKIKHRLNECAKYDDFSPFAEYLHILVRK